MPRDEDVNALHLISDILDKLIDSQQSNAETNAALKKAVEDVVRELDELNKHFSNGFRADIKQHVDAVLEKRLRLIEQYFDRILEDRFDGIADDIAERAQTISDTVGGQSLITNIQTIMGNIESIKETQHSWWHWMKHSVLIIVGFGTVIGATIKVIQWIHAWTEGAM